MTPARRAAETVFGTCPSGSWGDCPNAFQTMEGPWKVMKCKVSEQHPDLCHNYSKPIRTVPKLEGGQ